MKKTILLSLVASALAVAGGDVKPEETTVAVQEESVDFGILQDFKYNGQLRTRYESVDDSVNENADAITTRFALSVGANIGGIEGLRAFGEMMAVVNYGYDEYAPEQEGYALIADPQNNRITQAYLDYKMGGTLLRAGRQMVNLDDQRFVGAVGWRQMPQTFTSYAISNSSIENLNVMAAYVTDRHGVTDALSGKTETVLLHADYTVMPELKLTAYGYLIGSSSDTYGLMATGKVGAFKYIAEVATQQDASMETDDNGKPTVDALYFRGDISTNYNGFIAGVAYESLGDADGQSHGFTTPLATLHKWQGFADVFLGYTAKSNTYGLNDLYAKVGYKSADYGKVMAFYHTFSTIETTDGLSDNAGSEIDVLYSYKFSNGLALLLKAALFTGEENSVITAAQNDVTKYWVQLDYKF